MITTTGSAGRLRIASALCALLLIAGCVRLAESEGIKRNPPPRQPQAEVDTDKPETGSSTNGPSAATTDISADTAQKPEYRIFRGSGRFVRSKSDAPATIQVGEGGDISLDFADADIRQVVQATVGDILGLNYVIAPEVQGTITAQTERPLSRDALLPALESILRMHGVALVLDGALYRVQSIQGAARGPRAVRVGSPGAGYGVQVVQLNYVGAEDMRAMLSPLAGEGAVLHANRSRNLLILAGSQPELRTLLDAVRIFDVNWLAGMSFGLFPLESASPKTLIEELRVILDTDQGGALAGVIRLMPIERMNAVLAISKQPRYLDSVSSWIKRLDQGSQASSDQQLYIYFVQNSKASELADVLNQVFGGPQSSTQAARPSPTLAPGLDPVQIGSRTGAQQPTDTGQPQQTSAPTTSSGRQTARSGPGLSDTINLSSDREVRIVADEGRNALLISGNHSDYRAVLRALRQLDRRPLEVLVEVTIADVTLSDRLEYGVRWFLQSAPNNAGVSKHGGTFSDLASGAVGSTFPGLSYVFESTNAKAVVDLLSSVTDVEIISAPQILVLNNQEAQLQVGAQVPVATQQSTSVDSSGDPVIVSSIELKDTGVILKVTPRVNEGGLIILDIEQEVSHVSQDSAAGSLTPTISKRIITTTAAVQSGQTVALGGLIQDNKGNTKVGIPGLSAIPFLGALFRYTTDTVTRSELLVMVSPRVISDMHEAQEITNELRRRMEDLERLEAKIRPVPKTDED